MPGTHDPYAALRYRDYRRLLCGNVLTSLATEMQAVAIGFEIYLRTDSPAMLGLVGLVLFLPVLLFTLPGGQAADRYNRKYLLLITQATLILASLGLAALSFAAGPLWLVYLCLLLVGVARAFGVPARWSLVSQLVPADRLGNAVTWNSSGWQVAAVTGPSLGGLVLAVAAPGYVYLLTAACIATSAALVATLRPRPVPPTTEGRSLASLLAGARFVWRTKPILATLTLDLLAVLMGGATALLPIFAKDVLQVGPAGLGLLRAAPSLGALGMAVAMAHRPPLRRPGPALLLAVAGFGVATIFFGLSDNFLLSFAMLALTGACDNISVVIRHTLVQVLTPDTMRGRVAAVNTLFISSSNELGAFESGLTADWWGPIVSVVVGGSGTIVVALLVAVIWPEIVRLGALHPATDVHPPDTSAASGRAAQENETRWEKLEADRKDDSAA